MRRSDVICSRGRRVFSSSASGYSKGLALLLLGQKSEEKPMKVTPWNQYQLVDQETNPDLQLASKKNHPVHRCASFVCFGCPAAGIEGPSPPKVGPTQNKDVLPNVIVNESKDSKNSFGCGFVDGVDDSKTNIVNLKSSLKKGSNRDAVASFDSSGKKSVRHYVKRMMMFILKWREEKCSGRIQLGESFFEIREFEMSEDGSENDFDHGNEKTCSCRIM